jgi:hypothetical protein
MNVADQARERESKKFKEKVSEAFAKDRRER